jgi:hypothetical protein
VFFLFLNISDSALVWIFFLMTLALHPKRSENLEFSKYLILLLRYDNICTENHQKFSEIALLEINSNSIFRTFIILIFSNSHVLWRFNNEKDQKLIISLLKISSKSQFLHQIDLGIPIRHEHFWKILEKFFWQCTGCAVKYSAEIWCRSENIQALGHFSNLIGEKSLIRR